MLELLGKKIIEMLKSMLARKVEILIAAAWTLILSGSVKARHYLAQFVPLPADEWAVLTTGAALAGILTAVFSYFWFLPKFKPTDFGTHINIKTGDQFCSTCLLKNKIHSPMFLDREKSYWICPVDKSHRRDNPDYVEPVKKNEHTSYPPGYPGY